MIIAVLNKQKRINAAGKTMAHSVRKLFISLIILIPASLSAFQPSRMDVFDNSGNALLFVEFEYDSDGKNTGRSIYASDSTFLRRTAFMNDESGKRDKEFSFNFNDDTTGYTVFSAQNDRQTVESFDRFGLSQFGKPVNYSEEKEHEYAFSQSGASMYNMVYTYTSEDELSRIDVMDKNSQMVYYATFSSQSRTIRRNMISSYAPRLTICNNICRISVTLEKESTVKAVMYNLAGKQLMVAFSKKLKAGPQTADFKIDQKRTTVTASGIYFIRLTVDGKKILDSKTIKTW